MNSARDRAENIIDELQEFLNRQHSKDDTLSDLDLSISHSSSRTGAQTPVANGDGADLDVARWPDSFSFSQTVTSSSRKEEEDEAGWGQDGGGTLGDQSKMAGSSEVLMSSSGEVRVAGSQHSVTASVTLTHDPNPPGAGGNDGRGEDRSETSAVTQHSTPSHAASGGEGWGRSDINGTAVTDAKVSLTEKTFHWQGVNQTGGVFSSSGEGEGRTAASSRSLSSSSLSSSSAGETAKNEPKPSPAPSSSSELIVQQTSLTMSVVKQNHQLPNGGSDGENVTLESYDFLEPAPPPPPPKEFRDSTVMPFPMIFRRSKKDPGSKQYNELVKELEQVLEKRNDIRRSKSMRDDADIPETVGSLRASRKMSSSMDNLSVFANKALLSKLESHLKNRGSPGSAVHPGSEKSSPESDEPDITAKFGVVLKSPVKTEKNPPFFTSADSNTTPVVNGHTSVGVGQTSWTTAERRTSSTVSSPTQIRSSSVTSPRHSSSVTSPRHSSSVTSQGHSSSVTSQGHSSSVTSQRHSNAVSVVTVSSDAAVSRSRAGHVTNGHADSSSLSPHSVHEQESFSQDMSFGSEEEFPSSVGPYGFSTLPNMGHYKKNHQHVTGRSNHLHSHSHSQSHLHRSSFSPDVMYRSQTLDSNFRHITRISVSKSMDSLPGSRSNQSNHSSSSSSPPPHHQSQDLSHRWTLDRQGSVPMKTIVEHFNETDPEDIPAWNAALKNSKKHKERGVHRSISQRMVQKIFRVIRPSSKSNASAPVSRSSSFSPASRHVQNTPQARADDSHVQRNSTSRISGADDLVVELPSQQKVSVVPISDVRGVRSESRSVGNEVRHTHVQQDTQDGRLTVELPNKHIAAIVPVSSHTTQNIGGWTHTTTDSTSGQVVSRSRTSTVHRGSNHNSSDNSLTVELPNHHRANIVPTLPRTSTSNTANSVNRLGFPQGGNPNVKLVRSASAASAYRQTYRPAEKGKTDVTHSVSLKDPEFYHPLPTI